MYAHEVKECYYGVIEIEENKAAIRLELKIKKYGH
jgi:hypothetical protein